MTALAHRDWVPAQSELFVQALADDTSRRNSEQILASIDRGIALNRAIHERDCLNLNPGTNVMNPRAEAALASGLGSRPSLGYPGDKYEMGLEGVEQVEIIAAELAAEVFGARFAEIRVPSGAIANLYAFMLAARPGERIIVPPPSIGGHVTHNVAGCAGRYGLEIHTAAVDADGYTVDIARLRDQARRLRPKLITIGSSLNLFAHPVREIRAIADEVGALTLFDAAHLCGMIAGRAWQQPLEEGAHLMTMSTYKSLGGPASGLILTSDPAIAEKLDAIAFPGLTANFDAAKSAALAIALLDWKDHGRAYAAAMAATARALADQLTERGIPVFRTSKGATTSHQFAIEAAQFGGGQRAARLLRKANILSCGIGLPIEPVEGDMNGLRLGTPEIVRWGITVEDMPELAALVARGLRADGPGDGLAAEVTAFRRRFDALHFIN
ncbi:MAG: aminotransferase class I/II-fold pyridoxal phosphate-dependent enzyme [Roseiarcus sp.]